MSSETGTVDVAPERIKRKSRLRPGQMFLVDLVNGRVIEDAEIKGDMCKQFPYVKTNKLPPLCVTCMCLCVGGDAA
jgi:hypothetical protein